MKIVYLSVGHINYPLGLAFTVAFANAEKKVFCVSDAHLLEVTDGQIKAHVSSSRVESCYTTDVIWMPIYLKPGAAAIMSSSTSLIPHSKNLLLGGGKGNN